MEQNYENSYLAHYGVKGMRWGIRRNIKKLNRTDSRLSKPLTISDSDTGMKARVSRVNRKVTEAKYKSSVNSLERHKKKAGKQIDKLEKKRPKLEKKVEKHIMKTDRKVAKLDLKAAKKISKAGGRFVSTNKAVKRIQKAQKYRIKSDVLKAKSQRAKQVLSENTTMINAFNKGINDIDAALIERGRRCFVD